MMFTECKVNFVRLMLLLALFGMSACQPNYIPEKELPKLPCKVPGACDAAIIKHMNHFRKIGVGVITMGDSYMVSLPASMIFEEQSPKIKWASYRVLNEVVVFLKQFRKIEVHVTGYSVRYISSLREHALTLARSRIIGEYFWSQGIDSRLIVTEGLGSDKPITSVRQGGDKSPNARIEITFRRAVA
jgi:intracellular multiplication protein IcmN